MLEEGSGGDTGLGVRRLGTCPKLACLKGRELILITSPQMRFVKPSSFQRPQSVQPARKLPWLRKQCDLTSRKSSYKYTC